MGSHPSSHGSASSKQSSAADISEEDRAVESPDGASRDLFFRSQSLASVEVDFANHSSFPVHTARKRRVSFLDETVDQSAVEVEDQTTSRQVEQIYAQEPGTMPPTQHRRPMRTVSRITNQENDQLERKHPELKEILAGIEQCGDFLSDRGNHSEQFFPALNELLTKKIMRMFEKYTDHEQRLVLGNRLATDMFVVDAMAYYKLVCDELDIEGVTNPLVQEGMESKNPGIQLIMTFREIFWNFSDNSGQFARALSETDLFKYLAEDLRLILDDTIEELEEEEDMFAFSSAVCILHNCAREETVDRHNFRDVKAVKRLMPFLKSSHIYVKMITLLALAHITDENDSDNLGTDPGVFDFLFKTMENALAKNKREHGFSVTELVDGLAGLARAEHNKQLIMDRKPMPLIRDLLKKKDNSTKLAAVRWVWELCFNKDIKKQFSKDKEIPKLLGDLAKTGSPSLAQEARRALFTIEEGTHHVGASPPERPAPSEREKHIMISYSWNDQKTVLQIYNSLIELGYSVWLDVEHMGNYLLDGMSEAIDNAFLILICFSESYKNSRNCHMEADYVWVKQKQFLTLKMQQNYKPDGWLGILVGAQVFFDFSGKYKFEKKLEELDKGIKGTVKHQSVVTPGPSSLGTKPTGTGSLLVPVSDWEPAKVTEWLRANKMEIGKSSVLKKLTGEHVAFLHKLSVTAPEAFYRILETKVGLQTLDDIMHFSQAIEALKQQRG